MDNIQIGVIIAVIIVAVVLIVLAVKQPKKVKKWLLYAVSLAEMELGGGSGELKLLKVYNMFVEKYPVLKLLVSFDTFHSWVKLALKEMDKMLENNIVIKEIVSPTAPFIDVDSNIL